jgi:predicted RNA-binding protein with TRAM domain
VDQWTNSEVKRTSGTETQLHALRPHTTYVLQVRAYTSAGDGVASRPVHCITDEDGNYFKICKSIKMKFNGNILVPGQPSGIKAISLTGDSILASWLPPNKPNGHIKHYTLYLKESSRYFSFDFELLNIFFKFQLYHRSNKHSTYIIQANETSLKTPVITTGEITYVVKHLKEGHVYEFWVSATTGSGEGEVSSIVKLEPTSKSIFVFCLCVPK